MTSQTHPEVNETLLERMLIERAGAGAPPDLVRAIATAVESTSQRPSGLLGTGRRPWRFQTMPMLLRFATAAVIAVLAIGGAFYLTRPSQPAAGGPSPTPGASTRPSAILGRAASWAATGSMGTARWYLTATLLPDGKVLVAGGENSGPSAELYDSTTGSWTATGSMATPRSGHTATLLGDGKVLVAGGWDSHGNPNGNPNELASAELYDPSTGTWTRTGSMTTARANFSATLLPDGKVLVAGGTSASGVALASAELYDPATGTWTATASLPAARFSHTATMLIDGKVLVAGGACCEALNQPTDPVASAVLYDPGTATWSPTGNMTTPRVNHTATLLRDGRVLVAGGGNTAVLSTAELYDPTSGTWTPTGPMVTTAGVDFSVTLLSDGSVLVAGGWDAQHSKFEPTPGLASAELYDPAGGTWTATASMTAPRLDQTATLLRDGNVLVAGGSDHGLPLTSAELYDPGSP
jgi:WD40 repeat protein